MTLSLNKCCRSLLRIKLISFRKHIFRRFVYACVYRYLPFTCFNFISEMYPMRSQPIQVNCFIFISTGDLSVRVIEINYKFSARSSYILVYLVNVRITWDDMDKNGSYSCSKHISYVQNNYSIHQWILVSLKPK